MAAPFNVLRSKLDRAIAAYLIGLGNCGGASDILPARSAAFKSYPNTTVRSTLSLPEVPLTGLRRVKLQISIKGQPSTNPSEANPDSFRKLFDARVMQTYDNMMQSDDGRTLRATAAAITAAGRAMAVPADNTPAAAQFAANNADMVDFTCEAIYDMGEGDGEASVEGTSWEEILLFDVLCSASNVD